MIADIALLDCLFMHGPWRLTDGEPSTLGAVRVQVSPSFSLDRDVTNHLHEEDGAAMMQRTMHHDHNSGLCI